MCMAPPSILVCAHIKMLCNIVFHHLNAIELLYSNENVINIDRHVYGSMCYECGALCCAYTKCMTVCAMSASAICVTVTFQASCMTHAVLVLCSRVRFALCCVLLPCCVLKDDISAHCALVTGVATHAIATSLAHSCLRVNRRFFPCLPQRVIALSLPHCIVYDSIHVPYRSLLDTRNVL